ncbi:MAG: DUF4040 domain-containing protein [Fimbriimonadaceae bacterium]|nr:DUF4040 domain-containing protein [Fimbriimonadaceae bacterium]
MIGPLALSLLLVFGAAPLVRYSGVARSRVWPLVATVPIASWILIQFAGQINPAINRSTNFFSEEYVWVSELGISVSLATPGVPGIFVSLVLGIGALIVLYAGAYFKPGKSLEDHLSWLLVFMGAMLGIFLAGDKITLFVFWELTSISSAVLIALKKDNPEAIRSSRQALIVTGSGGLALLAGLILVGEHHMHPGDMPVQAIIGAYLILLAAATKSAQVPFHFWLPGAMVAPTPVSAYLHSATMVKAGVYLMFLQIPFLYPVPGLLQTTTYLGLATALWGAYWSLRHTDLKAILAASTIGSLGVMFALAGLGKLEALQVLVVFFVAHALYKGALFMLAGAVDVSWGTRNVNELSGMKSQPLWWVAAGLASISAIGLPVSIGFTAKDLIYHKLENQPELLLPLLVALAMMGAMAVVVTLSPLRALASGEKERGRISPGLIWPALVLAVLGLGAPFFPGVIQRVPSPEVEIAPWYGFGSAFILSLVTWGLAAAFFWFAPRLRSIPMPRVSGATLFQTCLTRISRTCTTIISQLQSGELRRYALVTWVGVLALAGVSLWMYPPGKANPHDFNFSGRSIEIIVLGLMMAAAVGVIGTRGRLPTIVISGFIGLGVAFIFLANGAPDLAMTQIVVETLTVLLFVFVFYRLPRPLSRNKGAWRRPDMYVAIGVGTLMGAATYWSQPGGASMSNVSRAYGELAYAEAHGRNIVNVILVDFRALDTLGEITVLAIAAIGVAALIKLRPRKDEAGKERI